MTKVTYIEHNGTEHTVELGDGTSLMQGAVDNMIDGIVGECGGGLACATCHCYVEEAWLDKVGSAPQVEQDMLEFGASPTQPNSRLGCLIMAREELDGLVVRLPEKQF